MKKFDLVVSCSLKRLTMAYWQISTMVVLLSLVLPSSKSGTEEDKLKSVYVSRYGQDSNICGPKAHPCRSIAQAVAQSDFGGIIFLNESGTELRPFDCPRSLLENYHSGLHINKNLTMKGFYSTPHVFCKEGFHFQKKNGEKDTLSFELSGIALWATPLTFEDWHHIKILNCSFNKAPRALSVQVQNITTFWLDIQGFSSFHNNSQCINIVFLDNIRSKSRWVSINITGTHFEQNGRHGIPFPDRGVLKIASKGHKIKQVDILVFCEKVKCAKNQGPFINVKVSTAVTNETYKDVEFSFNELPARKNSSDRNKKNEGYSLYFSQTKETCVKFVNLKCNHNDKSVRCIKVQSDKAVIDIKDSYFHKQSTLSTMQYTLSRAGSSLSLEASVRATLTVLNTTFWENKADVGGAIFANSPGGFLNLNFTNVILGKCSAKKYGCAISVGKPSWARNESYPQKLYFVLRNVTIERWTGVVSKCTAVYIMLKSGRVTVEESKFHQKTRLAVAGAFFVLTIGGKTNVTVSKCSFLDNAIIARKGLPVAKIVAEYGNAGIVTFEDSLIVGSTKKREGLFLSPKYRIKLVNITMTQFRYGCHVVSSPPKNSSFPVDILVNNCTFTNNLDDILFSIYDPTSVHVVIRKTLFTSSNNGESNDRSYAVRISIPPLKHIKSSKATIELDNNIFNARPSSNLALFFEGEKNVTIRRTLFQKCINARRDKWYTGKGQSFFYETATGAISILTNPDKPLHMGCIMPNETREIHPSWSYDSYVLFEDNSFIENVGLAAGAVYLSNGFTKFRRCTFRDNFGIQQSGHVYSTYGTGRVDFEDCSFSKTKKSVTFPNLSTFNKPTFLYSESGGPLNLTNTSLISLDAERISYPLLEISSGGYVEIDETSKLQCSEGQELLLENTTHIVYTEKNNSFCRLNMTVLRYSCRSCPSGYYSLQKGVSRGLAVANAVLCLQCPFGASCIKSNIAAKPNFWGYQASNHPPNLEFITCPEHYCPSTDSTDYNSCHGNRNGTLCGKCANGFTETLFSAECCESEKCNNYILWVLTILLTVALALYLLIKPPILSFLGRQILWFYTREENRSRDGLGFANDREHSDSGYIKITFYFYQAAELLMIGSIEDCLRKVPFIYFVMAAFNFQVRTISKEIGCPFVGLTAVTKRLVLSGTVFVTMSEVVIIYGIHAAVNRISGKEKPSFIHYMAVVIELLLLGYERLAETSLTLMHCVSIGSEKWLFIDATVPCMQWWQYLLLIYIIVFVVPFIIVLYYGSLKLYKASISAGEFLAACLIPLPFLVYWSIKDILKRRRTGTTNAQAVNRDVLDILHGPFRKPNSEDNGTLYWESVLIGRRFILLSCQAFIANLMLRMVCMVSACFLMTIHHVWKKAYQDPLANKAETLSLVALSIIAVINLAKAALISFGISIDGPEIPYFETLEWFEVCALAFVPALVSILVSFAILSQLTRFLVFLLKKCYHFGWCKFHSNPRLLEPLSEPLLDNVERDSDDEQ